MSTIGCYARLLTELDVGERTIPNSPSLLTSNNSSTLYLPNDNPKSDKSLKKLIANNLKSARELDITTQKFNATYISDNPRDLFERLKEEIEKLMEIADVDFTPYCVILDRCSRFPKRDRSIDMALIQSAGQKINREWYKNPELVNKIESNPLEVFSVPQIIEVMKTGLRGDYPCLITRDSYSCNIGIMALSFIRKLYPEYVSKISSLDSEGNDIESINNRIMSLLLQYIFAVALDETRKAARAEAVKKYIIQLMHPIGFSQENWMFLNSLYEKLNQSMLSFRYDFGYTLANSILHLANNSKFREIDKCVQIIYKATAILNVQGGKGVVEDAITNICNLSPSCTSYYWGMDALSKCQNIHACEVINSIIQLDMKENEEIYKSVAESLASIDYWQDNAYYLIEAIKWIIMCNIVFPLSFAEEVASLISYERSEYIKRKDKSRKQNTYDKKYAIRFFCYRYIAQGINEHGQVFLPNNPSLKGKIFSIIGEIPLNSYYNVYYVYRLCKAYNVITGKMPSDDLVAKNEKFLELLRRAAIIEKDTQIETPEYLKGTSGIAGLFGEVCPQEQKAEKLLVNQRIASDAIYYAL